MPAKLEIVDNVINVVIASTQDTSNRINESLSKHSNEFIIYHVDNKKLLTQMLNKGDKHLLICNLEMKDFSALDLLQILDQADTDIPLILIDGTGSEKTAMECLQSGKFIFIQDNKQHLNRLPFLLQSLLRLEHEKHNNKLIQNELQESRDRYYDILENTNDLIQCLTPDGKFIHTNNAWKQAMGYTEEEIKSLNLLDVLHPESKDCCTDRFQRLLNGEALACIEFNYITKSGTTIYLQGDCGSVVKDGETIYTRGILKNITENIKVEQALKLSEARYQTLYENAPDIYTTISPMGEILSINSIGAKMLGYDVDDLIGESMALFIHPEDQKLFFSYIKQQFHNPNDDEGIEYRLIRNNGSIFWVHQRVSIESNQVQPRLLVVCRDVTERKELEQKLAHQASHDTLTNLINRRELENRLRRILSSPTPSKMGHALCYLDLDNFKTINDSCGHIAGDNLLRHVATLMQGKIRSRDTLARLGGDEFAILMEHCSLNKAEKLAANVHKAINDFEFYWRSYSFSIGVSIGIIPIIHGFSLEKILSFADTACYAVKNSGGNKIQVLKKPPK